MKKSTSLIAWEKIQKELSPRQMQVFENETWKDIPGYKGKYQASNIGRIRNIKNGNFVNGGINKANGYRYVSLVDSKGVVKNCRHHKVIAVTFIPNPDNKPYINHKDCNKLNNNINNLEWCTPAENNIHASKMGLKVHGEDHHYTKLKNEEVEAIRRIGDLIPSRRVAKMFGISKTNVLDIIKGKIWKNVK